MKNLLQTHSVSWAQSVKLTLQSQGIEAVVLDENAPGYMGFAGRVLDAHALQTVTIAAERIIPATDTFGATDAGVSAFIDKMLADWHTPAERDRFLAGLPELDARCRARAGKDFVDCAAADQVAVLTALDDEARSATSREHWFARLKYLTVYGYCTSEPGMRALGLFPVPWRYDGCAPVTR